MPPKPTAMCSTSTCENTSGPSSFDFRVAGFARIQAIGNKSEVWRLRLQFTALIPVLDERLPVLLVMPSPQLQTASDSGTTHTSGTAAAFSPVGLICNLR